MSEYSWEQLTDLYNEITEAYCNLDCYIRNAIERDWSERRLK